MLSNRLSGLAVCLLGILLLAVVFPAEIETVDYGWVRPATVPRICAICLVALGLAQAAFPSGEAGIDWREIPWVGLFCGVTALALYGLHRLDFIIAAPVFSAVIMGLAGERRPGWLAAGVIVLPAATWFIVIHLLERRLP